MNAGRGQWWLAAHVAPSSPDAKVEVVIQRRLDADETRQARDANAFVQRLASVAPYALLVRLYDELEQALTRDVSAQRRASDMNRAVRALGKAAGDLSDDLLRYARDDFDPGGDKFQELEQAIEEETERVEFRLLVVVGQIERGPFLASADVITIDPDAVAALGSAASRVQSIAEAVGWLRSGVVVAQRLISRQLLIYRERIEEASLFLRRLAAEIPEGAPTLVWSDSFDLERGEASLGQTSFDPLALDKALLLHRAIRQARTVLQATNIREWSDETHAAGHAPEGEVGGVRDRIAPIATPVVDEQRPSTTEGTESTAGDREDQAVDLRALVKHVTAFTDELEKAWSAALDSALLAEAQHEMDARYASLLRTVARRAGATDRALSATGIDPGLPAHPLQPDELARLSCDPEPEQCWRQRQLAEIDALTTLLEALKAMRTPSAHLIYRGGQRVESWWEAGAFALIRDRATLLLRISEQVALAEAALTGASRAPSAPPAFVDRLKLANTALGHGDIDATLMHAQYAIRLRVALEQDIVADDLLERLAQDERLARDATVLRLLDEAIKKMAAMEELDMGVAILLAPRALAVAHRLCFEEPQIIRTILENRGGHAGS